MPVANRDPDVRHPILLPAPQRLRRERGGHRLSPGRLIHVTGGDRAALLRIGTAVRDALAEAGASWQLTAHGGSGAEIGVTVAVDPARVSRAQGYLLAVGRERIEIVGHDEAGAFYGAMTLRQIARQARDGVLACVRIADYPDVVHRGVMLDISRDRVPAMETLFGLVDLLGEWKVNQLQLYTEHTFAYRNHREVWADWSPMTGEQVMELDAYCRDRYVELVPNQNTFGHLARWMVHPRYRPLCEDDDPAVFHPHRGLYGTLCPTDPGSIALVDELLEELLPHFTSRQVHIGCDEARIGLARSRRVVEERGAGPVYLDYVRQVHELVRRRGRTTQLWGDVLINHAELASEFPAGAIPVMENYAADAPFDTYADTCVQAGLPFYLSPGINCWSTIIGNTATALANIRRAGESAVRHGAAGVLNTGWGDNGHWQHLPVAFPGYAYGAAMGWAPAANADLDLPAALDAHAFRDAAGVMGRLVCDLGDVSRCHDALAGSHGPLPAWILIGLPRCGGAARRADRGGARHGRGAPGTGDGAPGRGAHGPAGRGDHRRGAAQRRRPVPARAAPVGGAHPGARHGGGEARARKRRGSVASAHDRRRVRRASRTRARGAGSGAGAPGGRLPAAVAQARPARRASRQHRPLRAAARRLPRGRSVVHSEPAAQAASPRPKTVASGSAFGPSPPSRYGVGRCAAGAPPRPTP